MSLSKYETFMEVAKTESMSKAALNTHQTVPGVSYAIAKLEEEWGIPLFVRNRSKISLTASGEELMPYITEVLKAQEKLEQAVLSIKGIEKGVVRVGGLRRAAKQWFPLIIKEMENLYPNIQIKIVLNPYEEIKKDLLEGTIDVAFAGEPTSKMLDFMYLFNDPYVVIMSKGHPLSKNTSLTLNDIGDEKLIMPNWSYDKKLMELIEKSHLDKKIAHSIKDVGTIISMVENDMGISILPKLLLIGEDAAIDAVELEDWPAKRFGIVTSALTKPSPAAKKFIQCSKKLFGES